MYSSEKLMDTNPILVWKLDAMVVDAVVSLLIGSLHVYIFLCEM